MNELFEKQISNLKEAHFHILYWAALAEGRGKEYNITNVFDDLKFIGATRTKQNAVSFVESLAALCFIGINQESNRKNIYISKHGAKALEFLIAKGSYQIKKSLFLEVAK